MSSPFHKQLNYDQSLHNIDLAEGLGEVELPSALARKYPHAPRQLQWQYVFPSPTRSLHPETKKKEGIIYQKIVSKEQ